MIDVESHYLRLRRGDRRQRTTSYEGASDGAGGGGDLPFERGVLPALPRHGRQRLFRDGARRPSAADQQCDPQEADHPEDGPLSDPLAAGALSLSGGGG